MSKYLNSIHSPEDLRKLSVSELEILAGEIRTFLIESVSKTGGHLASNLGVVELTIAMHYVFNSPEDHFVWDVSHQSYVHKILTGRKDEFDTLRQYQGLSGFTKRCESEHDKFDTGHSSTSISAGLGIALARDLNREFYDVLSVIGDGALTGGMAFEALNHLGHTQSNMKVILNDNAMSISKNVGGLSRALGSIRTNVLYNKIKKKTKFSLGKIPGVGKCFVKLISQIKGSFKYFLVHEGHFFEDLGLTYIGPVDGHNLEHLIEYLEMCKAKKGPVILHVITEKGHGYDNAVHDPDQYHGVGAFDPSRPLEKKIKTDYSSVVGNTLLKLARENEKIVAISAAMIDGTGLTAFADALPERTFDVGICEQHAVTMAAGMAAKGHKPFVAIYSTFLQRGYDQIVHDVCIQKLPVVFCIDRAGLVGNDGETHHGVLDISYLSSIPNMTILSPKDGVELEYMLQYASEYTDGPLAIRYPRGKALQLGFEPSLKPQLLLEGHKILILTTGKMVEVALEAARAFESGTVSVGHVPLIKPFDYETVQEWVDGVTHIITLEDHLLVGGFGDMCLRSLKLDGKALTQMGYDDAFICQGNVEELMSAEGIDAVGVIKRIKEVLNG